MNYNDVIKTILYISQFCNQQQITHPMHSINAELCRSLLVNYKKWGYLEFDNDEMHQQEPSVAIIEQILPILGCIRSSDITNNEKTILWGYVHRLSEIGTRQIDKAHHQAEPIIPF